MHKGAINSLKASNYLLFDRCYGIIKGCARKKLGTAVISPTPTKQPRTQPTTQERQPTTMTLAYDTLASVPSLRDYPRAYQPSKRYQTKPNGATNRDRIGETCPGVHRISPNTIEAFEDQLATTRAAVEATTHKSKKGRRKYKTSICPVCFTQPTFNGNCDCD